MRFFFTLMLIVFSTILFSQSLTGIWRGHFVQQGSFNPASGEFVEDRYKFEVQIKQLPNNAIQGVTYSYKTTIFYGKAAFNGIFNKKTKNVLIKELRMLELKTTDHSDACAMTCYLDYEKIGTKETLTGTYTSINVADKTNCGEGTVTLERVKTSDFKKENFLLKKDSTSLQKTTEPYNKKDSTTVKLKNSVPSFKKGETNSTAAKIGLGNRSNKPTLKPGAETFVLSKHPSLTKKDTSQLISIAKTDSSLIQVPSVIIVPDYKTLPIPRILTSRENKLIKTILIDENEVEIDYYDNGLIDNDTITVYDNNQLAISKGRLSYSPLTLKIHLDETHSQHEIVTVAENLGDVPPNTALMVITAGKKRYEIFITSDEQTNAKVILSYNAKEPVKIH